MYYQFWNYFGEFCYRLELQPPDRNTKATQPALSPSLWAQGYKYQSFPSMKRSIITLQQLLTISPTPFLFCHLGILKVNTPTQTIRSMPILFKFMFPEKKGKKHFKRKTTLIRKTEEKRTKQQVLCIIQIHRLMASIWSGDFSLKSSCTHGFYHSIKNSNFIVFMFYC